MKLRELTNVNALNVAQAQTIKGGARDTRTSDSGTVSASAFGGSIKGK